MSSSVRNSPTARICLLQPEYLRAAGVHCTLIEKKVILGNDTKIISLFHLKNEEKYKLFN